MERTASGSTFGPFELIRKIGQGGMGVVYEARQPGLNRRVAIKLIAFDRATDEVFRRRFQSESRSAASIEHPNVVPIYDAGEVDGVLYIAMRYIDGVDLGARVAAADGLHPQLTAAIITQVGSGLDAVHAAGLIHRDIKPANVLLAGPEGREHAYITDFGLAKDSAAKTAYTRSGDVIGSIDYVAPERFLGGRIDARTDIYALGCVLYYALTGEVPFPKPDPPAKMHDHLHAPPPAPSRLRASVPTALDAVVARAMAKEPANRFQSAGDLGRAVTAAATGTAVTVRERVVAVGDAAPDAPTTRTPLPTEVASTQPLGGGGATRSRRRWLVGAGALLATLLTGGGVAAVISQSGPTDESTSTTSSGPPDLSMTTYSRALYNVGIPNGWREDKNDEPISGRLESTWTSKADSNTSVLIDAQQPAASGTPIQNARSVRAQTSQTPGYQEFAFNPTSLAGRSTARWVFSVSGDKRVDYFFNACGTSFAVLGSTSPSSFPAKASAFRAVASSLEPKCSAQVISTTSTATKPKPAKPHGALATNGIGPVVVGMPTSQVERLFGFPDDEKSFTGHEAQGISEATLTDWIYRYPDGRLQLAFNAKTNRLNDYLVTTGSLATLSGAHVGGPFAPIRRKYGRQLQLSPIGAGTTWVLSESGSPNSPRISFFVHKGVIKSISGGKASLIGE